MAINVGKLPYHIIQLKYVPQRVLLFEGGGTLFGQNPFDTRIFFTRGYPNKNVFETITPIITPLSNPHLLMQAICLFIQKPNMEKSQTIKTNAFAFAMCLCPLMQEMQVL